MQSMGGGESITGMLERLEASDAAMVGLTARGNPLAMVLGLDRTLARKARMQNRYGGGSPGATGSSDAGTVAGPVDLSWRYDPNPTSPWRGQVDRSIRNYGDRWADQVSSAIVRAVERLHREGVGRDDVLQHFVNAQGQPDLRSPGGRMVFDELDPSVRLTLASPDAQAGAVGIIGETLMPRNAVSKDELVDAIAEAVGANAPHGAQAVAQRLGSEATALGSVYGSVNSIVHRAQMIGLSTDQARSMLKSGQLPAGYEHDPLAGQLVAMRGMLPDSLTLIQTTIPAGAASASASSQATSPTGGDS
jgi:hypothetical protein